MARVPFSWRTRLGVPLSFFFFSRVVLLYLHSTYQLSLFTFSLSKTPKRRTQKVSLSLGPRDFILPRPVCSRPPDLVTSKNPPCSKEKQNIRPRPPSTAQVRTYSRDFLQSSKSRPLRPQSPVLLSVIRIKEDERSLPRYHISRLAFGGLEHLHNLRRPCQHQRRAPVVTRLVHISPAGEQDSNMRGSIAPARGKEGSQPILVRGVDLE